MAAAVRRSTGLRTIFVGRVPLERLELRRALVVHAAVCFGLYFTFLLIAAVTGTLWITGGIGVFQNPPFYCHALITIASIPLAAAVLHRITVAFADRPDLRKSFLGLVSTSRIMRVVYLWAVTIGLFSLAASIVAATQYPVDVYDSAGKHPVVLVAYSVVRLYQYLVCYPLAVITPVFGAILMFRAVRGGSIRYNPFARDEMGGLRAYIRAVDVPIYVAQTLCVLLVLANYVGWGSFSLIPTVIGVGALMVITLMGVALHRSFWVLQRDLRRDELARVRGRQRELYDRILGESGKDVPRIKAMIEEIEASERLVEIIRKRPNLGWVKYGLNLGVGLAPPLVKLVAGG